MEEVRKLKRDFSPNEHFEANMSYVKLKKRVEQITELTQERQE